MWGTEPRLSYIKPVGTKVFYSIHHFAKIGKMDPHCQKGVLIGFDEEMKSYCIWDPETGNVIRSKDVSFEKADEDTGDIFYDEIKAIKGDKVQATENPIETLLNQDTRDKQNENGEAGEAQETVESTEPTNSFKTTQQSIEWPSWRKAIFTERDSIIENGVFEIIPGG